MNFYAPQLIFFIFASLEINFKHNFNRNIAKTLYKNDFNFNLQLLRDFDLPAPQPFDKVHPPRSNPKSATGYHCSCIVS